MTSAVAWAMIALIIFVALVAMMLVVVIMLARDCAELRDDVDNLTRRKVIVHPYNREDDDNV